MGIEQYQRITYYLGKFEIMDFRTGETRDATPEMLQCIRELVQKSLEDSLKPVEKKTE